MLPLGPTSAASFRHRFDNNERIGARFVDIGADERLVNDGADERCVWRGVDPSMERNDMFEI